MARRRCFSSQVVESDAFYALPVSAQALYLHLCMYADDHGFVNNARSIAAKVKRGNLFLQLLVEKRFLLRFEDVYVVRHWRISNQLRNETKQPLAYPSIAQRIGIEESRAYTECTYRS